MASVGRGDRRGVAVHEVHVVVLGDALEQRILHAAMCSWFQPMCGTGRPGLGSSRRTVCGRMPRHCAGAFLGLQNSSCMPRQMPSTGCLSCGSWVGEPGGVQALHGASAEPTPGSSTRGAARICADRWSRRCARRAARSANCSEARLAPPLSMMATSTAHSTPLVLGSSRALAPEGLAQRAARCP